MPSESEEVAWEAQLANYYEFCDGSRDRKSKVPAEEKTGRLGSFDMLLAFDNALRRQYNQRLTDFVIGDKGGRVEWHAGCMRARRLMAASEGGPWRRAAPGGERMSSVPGCELRVGWPEQ